MNKILNIGRTGLHSNQNKMDAIANNLANVNTTAYKEKKISFQELLVNEIHQGDVLLSENMNPSGINMGSKSRVSGVDFRQGFITSASGDYQLAIEGNGFFGVRDENDNFFLTRNGNFHINEDLSITDDSGHRLEINMDLPVEAWGTGDVTISRKGDIIKDIDEVATTVGKIPLYYPEVLDSLTPLGEGKYVNPEGITLYNSIDQEEMFGSIVQGALESSNVDIAKAMTDMIITQKSYSMSSKTIQTTDEIMGMINGIKR